MKTIYLNYEGYWRQVNFGSVPTYSGVYSFQECRYNADNTVTLMKLLYVGQAVNCRERIQNHEKLSTLVKSLSPGNELCVHTAPITDPDKSRAENALVYYHKPPFNETLKDSFNYDRTNISCSGKYSLLSRSFTVERTISSANYGYFL